MIWVLTSITAQNNDFRTGVLCTFVACNCCFAARKFHPSDRMIDGAGDETYWFAIVHAIGERALATTLKAEIETKIKNRREMTENEKQNVKGITFEALSVW